MSANTAFHIVAVPKTAITRSTLQCGCIVDAVAHHAGDAIPFLHVPDGVELGLGEQVATNIRNTCLRCDAMAWAVAELSPVSITASTPGACRSAMA